MTLLAFNFCALGWPLVFLSWLLPFLLGLWLGYILWAKYKKISEDLSHKISDLDKKIVKLESDLDICKHTKTDLESEIALLKGQLREKNLEISTIKSSIASSASQNVIVAAAEPKAKKDSPKLTAITGDLKKDDLKKIEGIGPKIEKLLHAGGILTFADLANAKIEKIQGILDDAGPKFNIANPETWSEQASFAQAGKWTELQNFQNDLKGGKKV